LNTLAAIAPALVYGFGSLSAVLLSLAYARDALSWLVVWRRRVPVVRAAIFDQVMFLSSFLTIGGVGAFVMVLHIVKFGGTLRIAPLAAMSTVMLFYGSWFAVRRYYARPVLKVFGASLVSPHDTRRIWTEPWNFAGTTLHGRGDWRAERNAVHQLSAAVGRRLAVEMKGGIDTGVRPALGFAAALAGFLAPMVLLFFLLPVLSTELLP